MDNQLKFDNIMTQIKLGGTPHQMLTVHMLQQTPIERLCAEGFRNWDGAMVLLPLWALEHMQPGESLTCIDNSVAIVGTDEIDGGITRGGCIAYGVPRDDIPKKEIA